MQLTRGQENALNKAVMWWNLDNSIPFEIAGYAGTGKSFLVNKIIEKLKIEPSKVRFLTYTGKASLVLRRKGIPSITIHRMIYNYEILYVPIIDKKTKEPVIDKETKEVKKKPIIKFRLKKKEELFKYEGKISLFVCDECSMISEKVWEDLRSFGIPIIVLGDLGQLSPIHGKSPLLKHPDVFLDEIMRTKADNPIVYISKLAREGKRIDYGSYDNKVFVIRKEDLQDEDFDLASIILTSKNKDRNEINQYMRKMYGFYGEYPRYKEKLICRKNKWDINLNNMPLVNGIIGYVRNPIKVKENENFLLDFRPEYEEEDFYDELEVDGKRFKEQFTCTEQIGVTNYNIFEFGYAITVHLSQGSSWEKVLYIHSPFYGKTEENKKLLYTAITRAEKQLILVL